MMNNTIRILSIKAAFNMLSGNVVVNSRVVPVMAHYIGAGTTSAEREQKLIERANNTYNAAAEVGRLRDFKVFEEKPVRDVVLTDVGA